MVRLVLHPCSASIGVFVFLGHETNADGVLKCADKAMYQAKAAGRNAIRYYVAD
ncbi:diguanylate cyclase [Marinobacter sp.]|uniref:diguanylate cyclase domain-containing protein n=1 Tax=Marinobacter sp. TaxID=50741 RepID=UPI00345B56BE